LTLACADGEYVVGSNIQQLQARLQVEDGSAKAIQPRYNLKIAHVMLMWHSAGCIGFQTTPQVPNLVGAFNGSPLLPT
jgi:hypothetical protein